MPTKAIASPIKGATIKKSMKTAWKQIPRTSTFVSSPWTNSCTMTTMEYGYDKQFTVTCKFTPIVTCAIEKSSTTRLSNMDTHSVTSSTSEEPNGHIQKLDEVQLKHNVSSTIEKSSTARLSHTDTHSVTSSTSKKPNGHIQKVDEVQLKHNVSSTMPPKILGANNVFQTLASDVLYVCTCCHDTVSRRLCVKFRENNYDFTNSIVCEALSKVIRYRHCSMQEFICKTVMVI